MKTIAFDASNQPLTIALFDNQELISQFETNQVKNHSEQLLPGIDQLMQDAGWRPQDLERVIVSQGPGSYTGLRLAVTTAKTLAFTLGLELVGVSSLALLAANVALADAKDTLIIPLMDARNQNVYAGQYQWQGEHLVNIINDQHTPLKAMPSQIAAQQAVIYVGATPEMQAEILTQVPQAQFAADNLPHAANLVQLARTEPVITAVNAIHQFNPRYLRLTQAEANWQQQHPEAKRQDYVEKVK